MEKLFSVLLIIATSAICMGTALPQHSAPGGTDQAAIMRADRLNDQKVVDMQGQELGIVKDVELNLRKGSIAYVVIEPGTKDRFIPVPFDAFLLTPHKELVLNVDPGRLLGAPSYGKNAPTDWSDRDWLGSISEFWSSGTTWQPAGGRTQPEPLR